MVICADNNCFKYLVRAVLNIGEPLKVAPKDIVPEEKKALLRLHCYCPGKLCAVDKVIEEFERESRSELREVYDTIFMSMFDKLSPPDPGRVNALRQVLNKHHRDPDDCLLRPLKVKQTFF